MLSEPSRYFMWTFWRNIKWTFFLNNFGTSWTFFWQLYVNFFLNQVNLFYNRSELFFVNEVKTFRTVSAMICEPSRAWHVNLQTELEVNSKTIFGTRWTFFRNHTWTFFLNQVNLSLWPKWTFYLTKWTFFWNFFRMRWTFFELHMNYFFLSILTMDLNFNQPNCGSHHQCGSHQQRCTQVLHHFLFIFCSELAQLAN